MSDLIEKHQARSDATGARAAAPPPLAPPPSQAYTPVATTVGALPSAGFICPSPVSEILRQSAAGLTDPRIFLIDVLTEFARPVEIAGAEASDAAAPPSFAEFVRALKQKECTIYVRGDYAVAVPKSSANESAPGLPPEPGGAEPPPPAASPWLLRIEFRRENGQWKITHLLPLAEFAPMVGGTAYAQPQPVCVATPAVYPPAYSAPQVISAPAAYPPAVSASPYPGGDSALSPPSTASIPE
jgi:hypothetical protein